MTITHDALDLTVQLPPPQPCPLDIRHGTPARALLVTSSGPHWRPVQACSLGDFPPPKTSTDIWWPTKHIWLASRRYTSYCNAFLFVFNLFYHFSTFLWASFSLQERNKQVFHYRKETNTKLINIGFIFKTTPFSWKICKRQT